MHSSKNLATFVVWLAIHKSMKSYILSIFIIMSPLLTTAAQPLDTARFEERSFSLGGGFTQLLDTYLSPLTYRGGHVSIMNERFSQTKAASKQWFAQSTFALRGDYTLAAEGRGLTVGGMVDYSYTYYYRPIRTNRWILYAGPQGQLRIGGIYNLRNSNNPAQLKLGVNLAASAMGKYSFALRNIPMSLRLQADIPLFGFAFAPDYGQSYYEIFYLGHSKGCVHLTSPHNNLSLRTGLSYDVLFRSCTIRLTWQEDLYHWRLGGHQYRMFTHSLMIGYVRNLYHVAREDEVKRFIPY